MKTIPIIILVTCGVFGVVRSESVLVSTNALSVSVPVQYGPQYHIAIDNQSDVTVYARPDVPAVAVVTTNFYNGSANVETSVVFCVSNATAVASGKTFSFPISKVPVKNIVLQSDSGSNKLVFIGFNK